MPLKNQALSTSLCIIIVVSFLFSAFFIPSSIAESPSGNTTFYFKDVLNSNEADYDSSGTFTLLSTIPPTSQNTSSYPPLLNQEILLKNGFSIIDEETLFEWGAKWAITLLDELEGYDDILGDYGDLLKQMEIILPNPLRIVEGYQHNGDEPIQLNGNINYDLFFKVKPGSRFHKNDQVKLRVFTFSETAFVPTEIANTTVSITPGPLEKIIQRTVTITNVSKKINPGQLLLFSIELMPGNKTISSLLLQDKIPLNNLTTQLTTLVGNVANYTDIEKVDDVYNLLKEIQSSFSEEELGINISTEDIKDILDSVLSVSFLYDSSEYPSSVTVPFKAAGNSDDNTITYYLHANSNMDSSQPTATTEQTVNLVNSQGSWFGPELSRNKIISDTSAIVYLSHKDLQKWGSEMTVDASLTFDNSTLATDSIQLDRTKLLSPSSKPYQFTFDELGTGVEITHGGNLGLQIALSNTSSANNLFRSASVLFDAQNYASMLSFTVSETDHIKASAIPDPASGKIIVGDTVTYTLDVTSDLEDIISVDLIDETFSSDEQAFWDVSISPTSLPIGENGNETVTVMLSSLGNSLAAYDEDPLQISLELIGNTGYDTVQLNAKVSPDAVTYDTLLKNKPDDMEIVHGTNETFSVTIQNNNTGLWKDSYLFTADVDKQNLSVIVSPSSFDNLNVGNETTVNVTVVVPKDTEVKEAAVTLTITSKRSQIDQQIVINVSVIGANVFETIFDYFEGIAESIGLKDVFGSYAPIVLAGIILIILFFILIMVAFILTNKYVDIICIDRIKEITPDKTALYEMNLRNPTNKTQTYQLYSDLSQKSSSWNISFSSDQLAIPPKQQQTITVSVNATDEAEPGDWNEFNILVSTEGKEKVEKIPLFCSLADGTVSLGISP
ncbi:MAG: hypothetical protein KGY50_01615, partial [Candidatus Thermoplasmatota archaeon]|nr:hypothetical protein [Candidatus Thermoplasmatota archaeon]